MSNTCSKLHENVKRIPANVYLLKSVTSMTSFWCLIVDFEHIFYLFVVFFIVDFEHGGECCGGEGWDKGG